ncbi:uncharacterized protein LOC125221736 isoform X2 [Salvia hispanica]|uniref:uncharacterized protein LOC125221736 isoform X2 n=1 Tax=Salvia hispanica TaxID=49212 RepID=UPI0020095D2F|nr:uncharacterized protein LOC125221736 isoform X2 [Salvia hispanica]
MSDEGEKTCPLCAEEMDLTDQQLKPCKCGYEICVWCWHHIMDMAEKDETEGRCPACRTPYNKEKIVGTTASCERLVSEMNGEKKPKSSKGKNQSSEGRKQLANMRVIQRNLVYVVGLPMNLADEDLLQCREYFGQYGKALKVSISRTATGAIQQFANSTCSVYITYSKEEEAVRCIQSVHGFVLDGKPLRACFGTTKYCHAWLRNVPCSNPDCVYLHEIGSQEDSFTKDEIVSAHTRVQHITGSTNSTQRRSGYVLPPPADEYYNSTSASLAKPINKTSVNTNNTQTGARISPPNSSSGRSVSLTAGSSGTRVANNIPLHTTTQCSKGALKKQDLSDGPVACSTTAVSQSQPSSLQSDIVNILITDKDRGVSQGKSEIEALGPVVKESNTDGKPTSSQSPNTYVHPATPPVNKQPHGPCTAKLLAKSTNDVNSSLVCVGLASSRDSTGTTNGKIEKIQPSHFIPNHIQENLILDGDAQLVRGAVTSQPPETIAHTSEEVDSTEVQSDFRLETASIVTKNDLSDIEDDILSFENRRLKDPEVASNRSNFSHASHLSSHSHVNCNLHSKGDASTCRQAIGKVCNYPIGHSETIFKTPEVEVNNAEHSNLFPSKEKRSLLGLYDGELCLDSFDMGESSIISNILSMDFDPWNESLISPQNLAKLLGENDKQGSFGFPGSRKNNTSTQSRFSFAREEPRSHASGSGQSVDYFTRNSNQLSFGHEFSNSDSFQLEKLDSLNDFPAFNGLESELFADNHSHTSSNRNSVSRPQVLAPPMFSVPSRTPPPGFTSQDRIDQIFDGSGNHLDDSSSLLRHSYQTPPLSNTISNGDIEFIDPAILAVGKGLLPGRINNSGSDDVRARYSSQLSTYEDAKFQSIFQRSLPSHQNQKFTIMGDTLSPLGDAYSISSRVMEQTLANNMSTLSQFSFPQSRNGLISNGQWAGNNLGMAELLRNERWGYNKFYGSYEDSKIRMPSSGSLYNGTYGY